MAKKEKDIPQELTKAELEIMQIMWSKGKVLVRDILESMPEPKLTYNTVSTVVRVLEKKALSVTKLLERPINTIRSLKRKNIPTDS